MTNAVASVLARFQYGGALHPLMIFALTGAITHAGDVHADTAAQLDEPRLRGSPRHLDRIRQSTHIGNGQILCRAHNRDKNAGIPLGRSLRRLAERRAAYYPPQVQRSIERRQSRTFGTPSR